MKTVLVEQQGNALEDPRPPRPHGSTSSWILVLMDQRPHGSTSSWIHVLMDQRPHGSTSSWIHVLMDPRPHGSTSSWILVLMDPRPHGSTSSWIHVLMDPRPHGSTGIHVLMDPCPHGSTSSWIHVLMDPRPHGSTSSSFSISGHSRVLRRSSKLHHKRRKDAPQTPPVRITDQDGALPASTADSSGGAPPPLSPPAPPLTGVSLDRTCGSGRPDQNGRSRTGFDRRWNGSSSSSSSSSSPAAPARIRTGPMDRGVVRSRFRRGG
ncbi:hypothetical protein FQA47_010863 [Oryzias melastigma]|uniref:Uncharacterized protein n=1 Tax=Oryzias melastigma TaxID=30732 RepID=A0A834BXR2_ORYME|nr:hypothetical protein FQA47_010863 [Oryzias melastigma]